MPDVILVINAGSSSLKFAVFGDLDKETLSRLIGGQLSGIATQPRLTAHDPSGGILVDQSFDPDTLQDHDAALASVVLWLRSVATDAKLKAVGHRVVHGGTEFTAPTAISGDILEKLTRLTPLAPLHQPANLAPIQAAMKRLPGVLQVACFDSAFHRSHPPVADVFALPIELHEAGIRRYGFHGLSYEHIARTLRTIAPVLARGRAIVAHLGSGASVCAMNAGISMDCTMSFTGLDGLPMGTRCGALDPAAVIYLIRDMKMSADEVERLLYNKSGLLGISGESNDMRKLLSSSSPRATFAVEHFVYRVSLALAQMAAALEGVDGIVFTGGIGEHAAEIRQRICHRSRWLGLHLDERANLSHGPRITMAGSPVSAWVIPADEEIIIARHTRDFLEANGETLAQPSFS